MLADTLANLDERSPKPLYLVVGMMGQRMRWASWRRFAGSSGLSIRFRSREPTRPRIVKKILPRLRAEPACRQSIAKT